MAPDPKAVPAKQDDLIPVSISSDELVPRSTEDVFGRRGS